MGFSTLCVCLEDTEPARFSQIAKHFFDNLNSLAHLPPILAEQDCVKPLFLPNGRCIPAPKAVRWSRCWAASPPATIIEHLVHDESLMVFFDKV
jgi:hypothetical protein